MAKKEVVFVLVSPFADWEFAHLAAELNNPELEENDFVATTAGVAGKEVRSMGGLKATTDYTLDEIPEDIAGLVLIGGMSWREAGLNGVADLVRKTLDRGIPVGSICDSTVFLGMHGLLNDHKHTSNGLDGLQEGAGAAYTNAANYQRVDAFRDGLLVTANGQAPIEFAKLYMEALGARDQEYLQQWFDFNKLGFVSALAKYYPHAG